MKRIYFSLRYLIIGMIGIVGLNSCAYDDYVSNYDFSAVSFASQKPLRTLVTREDSAYLTFKIGIPLSGLRENKVDQWATFEIAPDLLTSVAGASGFTLLPADWYTTNLTENKIIIPKGKFLGDFTIKIDKAKFTADPLSLTKKYALPIRLLETSADSILQGDGVITPKNYTIVVIKYINEYSGAYYVRGQQSELNTAGDTIPGTTTKYYKSDWSRNAVRNMTTLSLSDVTMTGLGSNTVDKMTISFGANKSVALTTSTMNSTLLIEDLGSSYDQTQQAYLFNYKYVKSGKTYKVTESVKLRNDPEKDLRFEEW